MPGLRLPGCHFDSVWEVRRECEDRSKLGWREALLVAF